MRDIIDTLDMKGCICHFVKWQIHPFNFKMDITRVNSGTELEMYRCVIRPNTVSARSNVCHQSDILASTVLEVTIYVYY